MFLVLAVLVGCGWVGRVGWLWWLVVGGGVEERVPREGERGLLPLILFIVAVINVILADILARLAFG